MDLKGSLVDTNLRIYPTENLLKYLKTLKVETSIPYNILKLLKIDYIKKNIEQNHIKSIIQLNKNDIDHIKRIEEIINENIIHKESESHNLTTKDECKETDGTTKKETDNEEKEFSNILDNELNSLFITTTDVEWLYNHLKEMRKKGTEGVPHLHLLLEGVRIELPTNKIIKRNPVLEARCAKLRAQQEAREYRKMTKSVDNVRMRYPEDSISYQLKSINRQLIAIGQFIISIFAGFLFGFRGIEWMVGNLDFGFRLLLGVMCALIIALAEIYFLAKKLNEELNIPETVQLGGPPKYASEINDKVKINNLNDKEHQD